MNKQYLLFCFSIILSLFFNQGVAQDQSRIDSLLSVLESAQQDTNKVNILNALCWEYKRRNLDKALNYGQLGLELAQELRYAKGKATSFNNIGVVYRKKGDNTQSIAHHLQALEIREKSNNKLDVAKSYNNLGIVYDLQGNYEKAIDYHLQALNIFEELGDLQKLAASFTNLGAIYYYQLNYEKAMQYYQQALKIDLEIGDKHNIAESWGNIGAVYLYRGNITHNSQDLKTAIEYHFKSLEVYEELGDKPGIAIRLNNISTVYLDLKEYKKAMEYSDSALAIAIELDAKREMKWIYQYRAQIFEEEKQYQEAYENYQLYAAIKDTLYNEESSRQIAEMQTKYETEKKEKENDLLTNQTKIQELQLSRNQYLIYGLTGVLLLVMLVAFLYIQQNKLRAQQRTMEAEQRLLRSQMNPHFISNSLIAIQSFIYKKDPEEAGRYLASFAKLMRLILENSREEYVPLDKEIKTLGHFLELQELRFENKFSYTIDVADEVDVGSVAIPPMLAQPFIENALEHGILHKDAGGLINVRINLNGDLVLLVVEDNGIGRQKSAEMKEQAASTHKSLSTTITQERLAILNKNSRQKIRLEMIDVKGESGEVVGTRATFHIPYRNV